MASRRSARYSRLPTNEDLDPYDIDGCLKSGSRHDPRFDYTPRSFDKVPWKSIALALFLLSLGLLLLFVSFFILTGHMGGDSSQAYGLLALGILTFLPEIQRGQPSPLCSKEGNTFGLPLGRRGIKRRRRLTAVKSRRSPATARLLMGKDGEGDYGRKR